MLGLPLRDFHQNHAYFGLKSNLGNSDANDVLFLDVYYPVPENNNSYHFGHKNAAESLISGFLEASNK